MYLTMALDCYVYNSCRDNFMILIVFTVLISFTSIMTYKSQLIINAYWFFYINFFILILDGEIYYWLYYIYDRNKSFCISNPISVYNPFLTILYKCLINVNYFSDSNNDKNFWSWNEDLTYLVPGVYLHLKKSEPAKFR